MDPQRFDQLSKTMATGLTRRAAVSGTGAGLMAGLLGGLGWRRALAAQTTIPDCELDFRATVRIGPNSEQQETKTIRGALRLTFDDNGAIDEGELVDGDGASFPVVGQATGRGISLWFTFADGDTLAATGASEQPISSCESRMRGTFSGLQSGDLGDWAASPKSPEDEASSGQATQTAAAATTTATANASTTCALTNCMDSAFGVDQATCTCVCGGGETSCVSGDTGICVDLMRITDHCGACFDACPSPAPNAEMICREGECIQLCQAGFDDCTPGACTADLCRDVSADPGACGQCDNACPEGSTCEGGLCTCEACGAGYSPAPGTCICVCNPGRLECPDGCVDPMSDPANCGGCGIGCRSLAACTGGQCICQNGCGPGFVLDPETCACDCDLGLVQCGNACLDLTSDPNNCGSCGRGCPTRFPDCSEGSCIAL